MRVFIPGQHTIWKVYIFILRWSARNFLGLVGLGSFSSHTFTDMSITFGYLTSLILFIFKMCVYKTLAFWENIEDLATFLRVTLSIFDVFVWRFLMEAPKLSDNFLSLSLSLWSAEIFLLTYILDGLSSCNQVVDRPTACLVALLWYIFCPSVPCDDRGSKVLGYDCFATTRKVLVSLLPDVHIWIKFFGVIPFSIRVVWL